ncbi:hypothetical protein F443_12142 [Phytophthora nicotianae P1569]|uniref:Uncharacterized protein n=2 Tax=Phytophthora nicotianae TaxID=4792 RepID=V9EV92_PHYNI|nr:hypothetical protein F443_12142 [Phytophthora nicotianae P1569]
MATPIGDSQPRPVSSPSIRHTSSPHHSSVPEHPQPAIRAAGPNPSRATQLTRAPRTQQTLARTPAPVQSARSPYTGELESSEEDDCYSTQPAAPSPQAPPTHHDATSPSVGIGHPSARVSLTYARAWSPTPSPSPLSSHLASFFSQFQAGAPDGHSTSAPAP